MAVRIKRRCRNCPSEATPMTTETEAKPQMPLRSQPPVLQITSQTEGDSPLESRALWCWCLRRHDRRLLSPRYAWIPTEAVKALVTRLQHVLKKIEAKNESLPPSVRLSPDASDSQGGTWSSKTMLDDSHTELEV